MGDEADYLSEQDISIYIEEQFNPIPKPSYKKRRPEKVQKIKLQDTEQCLVCNTTQNLQEHHCFGGALRSKSERYGLTIYLCMRHHTGADAVDKGVHFNRYLDLRLKRMAQIRFEQVYDRTKFMNVFGRNYL